MTNKLTFVRKLSLFLLAGTAFTGTAFAGENAKVKSIVDSISIITRRLSLI